MSESTDLRRLLRVMSPVMNPGVYVFASVPHGAAIDMQTVVACVQEPEGLSIVVPEPEAIRLGLSILFRAAWLTLTVHSGLDAVGLTAALSTTLARAGISCNVVAGAYHDHLFVPYEKADAAMAALLQLQGTPA